MTITRTVGAFLAGLTIAGGTAVSAQQWGRNDEPRIGACFYEDANFEGRYFCSNAGASARQVPSGTNDQISSIRLFGNVQVKIYRDANFEGQSRDIRSDTKRMPSDWNDEISSYRVEFRSSGGAYGAGAYNGDWGSSSTPRNGACFYEDHNYEGQHFCANRGTNRSQVPSAVNDQISSIRLYGDTEVTIYKDANYRGQSRVLTSNTRSFPDDWNDQISSFKVTERGAGEGDWGGGSWGGAYGAGSSNRSSQSSSGNNRNITYTQAQAMVRSAYLAVLGREPDAASRPYINKIMYDGWNQVRLMDELKKSDEYKAKHKGGGGR